MHTLIRFPKRATSFADRIRCRRLAELAAILLGAMLLGLAGASQVTEANHTPMERYRTFPGLDSSDLFQYGSHFDEGGAPGFLARDFNRPGEAEAGQSVYLRVQLSTTFTTPLAFRFTHLPNCAVAATAGELVAGNFTAFTNGQVFHFLHVKNRVASGTVTLGVTAYDASIYAYAAAVAPSGEGCAQPGAGAQLHQSADVGLATPIFRVNMPSGETCWTDQDGTYTWQCPLSTYKVHYPSGFSYGGCGSYSGSLGGLSATVAQYICEEWSYAGQTSLAQWSSAQKDFYAYW